jgi:hypothetical protein
MKMDLLEEKIDDKTFEWSKASSFFLCITWGFSFIRLYLSKVNAEKCEDPSRRKL